MLLLMRWPFRKLSRSAHSIRFGNRRHLRRGPVNNGRSAGGRKLCSLSENMLAEWRTRTHTHTHIYIYINFCNSSKSNFANGLLIYRSIAVSFIHSFIQSCRSLSYNKSVTSSKASSPQGTILCFLFKFAVYRNIITHNLQLVRLCNFSLIWMEEHKCETRRSHSVDY
jgi:hypothetical protein